MIEIKAIFGILSGIVVLIGGIPYIIDIHKKKAHPHVLSWLGWTFITALGASAMYAEGSTWVVGILWANALNSFLIAGYSVIKRVGVWSTGIYDYIFFGLGIVGLVLWQTLDLPLIALICAIVADLSFGLPTIIKAYKDPSTETPFVWLMSSISGLLSLFAIYTIAFHEVAYPLYLFIYDTIVLLLVLKFIRKPQKTIRKIAAIVIKDNKFLLVRKKGKDVWTSLGGKPEGNETEEETLEREVREELNCDFKITRKLLDVKDKAVHDDAQVHLSFHLGELIGTPEIIDNELEEFTYIPSNYKEKGIKIPPSLENQAIPFCIKEGLLRW